MLFRSNIPKIGEICAKHETPFHTDAVQVFGKFRVNMPGSHVNALSASFHKLYGPGGIGLLVIDNDLINKLLNNLKPKYYNEYVEWLSVGMAIKNLNLPFKLWDNFSKKSKKYENG